MSKRNRIIALAVVGIGVIIIGLFGIIEEGYIREKWYLGRLNSKDVGAQRDALYELCQMGSVKAVRPLLEQYSKDKEAEGPDMPVSMMRGSDMIVMWIQELCLRNEKAKKVLIKEINCKDVRIKLAAINVLKHIQPKPLEAIPNLREALEERDQEIRESAEEVLKMLSENNLDP